MLKASAKGVDIGSHPGVYDLHGFGRRRYHLLDAEVERLIAYQLGASLGMAALTEPQLPISNRMVLSVIWPALMPG